MRSAYVVPMAVMLALAHAVGSDLQDARDHIAEGRYRQAETILRRAARGEGESPEANHLWYRSLRARGEGERALGKLGRAADLAPARADWRLELGEYLYELGKTEEAVGHYVRALVIDPSFGQAHVALAKALLDKGMVLEAEAQVREALRARPRDPAAWALLGQVVVDRGPPLEALSVVQAGLEVHPTSADLTELLAAAYERLGETAKAASAFQRVAGLRPDSPEPHLNLGRLYRIRGDQAKALAAFRKAASVAPEDARAHVGMAWVYAEQPQRASLALRSAQHALTLAPKSVEAQAARGWALHKLKRGQEALEVLTAAASGKPGSAAAMYCLGEIAVQADPVQAEEWLRKAVAAGPRTVAAAKAQRLLAEMRRSGDGR